MSKIFLELQKNQSLHFNENFREIDFTNFFKKKSVYCTTIYQNNV